MPATLQVGLPYTCKHILTCTHTSVVPKPSHARCFFNHAVLYLKMNPHARVYSFDVYGFGSWQDAAVKYIQSADYGRRWQPIKGDSAKTVPEFAAAHSNITCDVVHVDGNHAPGFRKFSRQPPTCPPACLPARLPACGFT